MLENSRRRIYLRKTKKTRVYLGLSRFFRYFYLRLMRLRGHPIEIARGLAVGVFSGFFPWMGLQIAIALFLAILVRGNKIAAAAATWISNPLTSIPIFIFNYKVGEAILGRGERSIDRDFFQSNGNAIEDWTSLGGNVLLTLFFGSCLTGAIGATITYFLSLRLLDRGRGSRRSGARR